MRRESAEVIEKNMRIVERFKELNSEHPFWGYRRIWAHLRFVDEIEVNKKRVFRLMQKHRLLVRPNMRLKTNRTPNTSKPRPDRPDQWWGIDMTRVMVERLGWMYNNPKGNADTERFIRTFKEELLWLKEWTSPFELAEAVGKWIGSYNRSYLHLSLGYRSPEQYEREHQTSQNTQLVSA